MKKLMFDTINFLYKNYRFVILSCLSLSLFGCVHKFQEGFNLLQAPYDTDSRFPILLSNNTVLFEPDKFSSSVFIFNPRTNRFDRLKSKEINVLVKNEKIFINHAEVLSPYNNDLIQFINYNYGTHLKKSPLFSSEQYGIISAAPAKIACTNESFCAALQANYPKWSNYAVSKLKNGDWLITGGDNGSAVLKRALIFKNKSRVFVQVKRLNYARTGHISVTLPDGKVALLGGQSWNPEDFHRRGKVYAVKEIELFDPRSKAFHSESALKNGFINHGAILLNHEEILIFGGANPNEVTDLDNSNQSISEIYNIRNGKTTVRPMVKPRGEHPFAIRLLSGGILVTDGRFYNHGESIFQDGAELFIPEVNGERK